MSRWQRIAQTLEAWHLLRPWLGRVPTWRGWLFLLLAAVVVPGFTFVRFVHPFLAVTERESTDILVVEGWLPDYGLKGALEEFRRGGYRHIYVVGIPLEKGELLSEFGTYAEAGRLTLERLGAPVDRLLAVPAPKVRRDRTFASAAALRDWLVREGKMPAAINVVTSDAHARRSRLLFAKAFGDRTRVGIVAAPEEQYDGPRWWRYSQGVRIVLSEWLGYLYARVLFASAADFVDQGDRQSAPDPAPRSP